LPGEKLFQLDCIICLFSVCAFYLIFVFLLEFFCMSLFSIALALSVYVSSVALFQSLLLSLSLFLLLVLSITVALPVFVSLVGNDTYTSSLCVPAVPGYTKNPPRRTLSPCRCRPLLIR
jgi:hypothetical protein